jgi:hypothetical protein
MDPVNWFRRKARFGTVVKVELVVVVLLELPQPDDPNNAPMNNMKTDKSDRFNYDSCG